VPKLLTSQNFCPSPFPQVSTRPLAATETEYFGRCCSWTAAHEEMAPGDQSVSLLTQGLVCLFSGSGASALLFPDKYTRGSETSQTTRCHSLLCEHSSINQRMQRTNYKCLFLSPSLVSLRSSPPSFHLSCPPPCRPSHTCVSC